MNKKDSLDWEMKRLRKEKRVKSKEKVLVPIEKDAYVELLEDEIVQLREQIDTLRNKTVSIPAGNKLDWTTITWSRG